MSVATLTIPQSTVACRSDTVRARVAAGIFDRIANWNGFGRALYPTTAGVDVTGEAPDITTSVGLMSQAGLLKIPPKLFSRPGQQFEVEDLDRCPAADNSYPIEVAHLLNNNNSPDHHTRDASSSHFQNAACLFLMPYTTNQFSPAKLATKCLVSCRNDIVVAIDSRTKARLEAILCEGVPDCKDTMAKVLISHHFNSMLTSWHLRLCIRLHICIMSCSSNLTVCLALLKSLGPK